MAHGNTFDTSGQGVVGSKFNSLRFRERIGADQVCSRFGQQEETRQVETTKRLLSDLCEPLRLGKPGKTSVRRDNPMTKKRYRSDKFRLRRF